MDKIPKFLIVRSEEPLTLNYWTRVFYDELGGEKHLLVVPNTNKTKLNDIPSETEALTGFIRSVASNQATRPAFNFVFSNNDGMISL